MIFFAIAAPPTIGTITHIVLVFLFARAVCVITRCEENDFYVVVVVVVVVVMKLRVKELCVFQIFW